MLTTRLRNQIEWHFYNHNADLALYENKTQDILDSGLTVNFNRIGCSSCGGSQTESKALRLEALDSERNWAAVVKNTFTAFRFEPEYELMLKLYIDHIKIKNIIKNKRNPKGSVNESTLWYWRDRWLATALMWAEEFKLL